MADDTKKSRAAYMRNYRANKKQAPGTVSPIRSVNAAPAAVPAPALGEAELAVIAELATLTSAETRKAAAAGALAMARILDNPNAISQQPQAMARLMAVMDALRQGAGRRKGRLASVQAITREATG